MRKRQNDPRVFPLTTRQARNIFYGVCKAARLHGRHCHPHTARHTVVHQLFSMGNSLPLIAKFLGHRTVRTTEQYYLRLSFGEIMRRIQLPWTCKACARPDEQE